MPDPEPTVLRDNPAGNATIDPEDRTLIDSIWSDDDPPADPPADPPVDPPEGDPPVDPTPPVDGDPPIDIPEDLLEPPVDDPPADPPADDPPDAFPGSDNENQQKEAWNRLAFEKRDLKRRVAEQEKAIADLKEAAEAGDPDEIFRLKETVEQLETKIGQFSLAETSSFKREFDRPIQERLATATRLLTRSGMEPAEAAEALRKVMGMADLNARVQLLDQEVPAVSGALVAIFEDVDSLRVRRSQALTDWKSQAAALEENRKRDELMAKNKVLTTVVSEALTSSRDEGNFFLKAVDGRDTWNQKVAERTEAIKGVIARQDPAEIARFVADGISGRELRELYQGERTRRREAEAKLSAIEGAAPDLGGRSTGVPPQSNEPDSRTDAQIIGDIWQD